MFIEKWKLKVGKGEGEDLHKGTVKNREKTLNY